MNMLKNEDLNENETKNNYTVYIHTNKTNNKKYIGITSRTPEERWMSNGLGYRGQGFYNAIIKYGWDNFDHEIVAKGLTKDEACLMEIGLISKYDTIKNGYNQSLGGEMSCHFKFTEEQKKRISETRIIKGVAKGDKNPQYGISPIERMDAEKYLSWKEKERQILSLAREKSKIKVICVNDYKVFNSMSDAGRFYGIKPTLVSACCSKRHKSCDIDGERHYFEYYIKDKDYSIRESMIDRYENLIICVETGELFPIATDVEEKYSVDPSSVLKHCKSKKGTVRNMHFAYYKDYLLLGEDYYLKPPIKPDVKVYQLNPVNLDVVQVFDRYEDAENYIGCQRGRLSYYWNNNKYRLHDYYWCKESDYLDLKTRLPRFGVLKINPATNEIIGEYVSATHAAKENPQCDAHGIRHVLRGSLKTHKGFIWKKID